MRRETDEKSEIHGIGGKKESPAPRRPDAAISLHIAAPAKINLFLHVTGRRADGYHLLESLVTFADAADRLDMAMEDDLTLEITGPFASALTLPPQRGKELNIVLRAATLLQAHAGSGLGARLTLLKALPVAAGLGGGSADAAAALRGLRQLWNLDVDDGTLANLALQLGSDVPVCLASRTAWMRGIGETLSKVTLPALWMVLVNPGAALSTADVFRNFSGAFAPPKPVPDMFASVQALVDFLGDAHNALEPAARALAPVISDVLAALQAGGALLARMSGSGATCFGLYADAAAADAAAARISTTRPEWWCVAAGVR
ncbi:MAG: 4-(cytidine 5'-diphospho)-2-C-methyl-D-erythritol kinase [Pseudomonadota bacterium]|nr:4-(cytidine 5'-diphospho)-2-C-methyl-D-erythritol kinase [Pseudomonadota bacterium]MDE3038468.1 4-(cytidine 5'-diphospho)-2-C-methyl-D-erythritol kinase [Pseudomonadota bacterium]